MNHIRRRYATICMLILSAFLLSACGKKHTIIAYETGDLDKVKAAKAAQQANGEAPEEVTDEITQEETGAVVEDDVKADVAKEDSAKEEEPKQVEPKEESKPAGDVKIRFKNCANEEMSAAAGDKVTLPEYIGQPIMKFFKGSNVGATEVEIVKDLGNNEMLVKPIDEDAAKGYRLYTGSNGPAFMYMPIATEEETEFQPEDFGLLLYVTVNVNGSYSVLGLQDESGKDYSDILVSQGTVIGWSTTENATEAEFAFGDSIDVKDNVDLFPVFSEQYPKDSADIDTTDGFWIKGTAGTVVKIDESLY